ncbi:MAG: class I SAM-dependent methyltransferase [Betaproteobacteria bacterium]|nr:class I SAM-dependent methyltransferase [Betaproteobacteria bacterium]
MTLDVLYRKQQIGAARRTLRARRLSCATPGWKTLLQRYRMLPGIRIGDRVKSWDVLKTVGFIESHVAKDKPVLDIGAYASEVPLILHRLGYRRVAGIDLNPDIVKMPFAGAIDYRVGDFLHAPFPDRSFAAVTAISVIEHGFNGEALAAEVTRLLKPGGFFIASFDYWPEKISTDGQDIFGMSWTIFSKPEVEQFIALAKSKGLVLYGPMDFSAGGKPISCFGRDYTFAWLVLKKQ